MPLMLLLLTPHRYAIMLRLLMLPLPPLPLRYAAAFAATPLMLLTAPLLSPHAAISLLSLFSCHDADAYACC